MKILFITQYFAPETEIGGIRILEITLTTPDAFELISTIAKRYFQFQVQDHENRQAVGSRAGHRHHAGDWHRVALQ